MMLRGRLLGSITCVEQALNASFRAGLADPGPIASALWVDAELYSSVSLDSIVTVVDAHHLKKQLQESRSSDSANEAERQIAFADTILLNKVVYTHQHPLQQQQAQAYGIFVRDHHFEKTCRHGG